MGQIAIRVLIIEPVAHDECVRNIEHHVIGLHIHFLATMLPQQHERADGGGPHFLQHGHQCFERVTRVENVVDDEHVPTGNFRQQLGINRQLARRGSVSAITARAHKADAQRQVDASHQIGHNHNAAGQHANDRERLATVDPRHILRHVADTLANLFFTEQDFHGTDPLALVRVASSGYFRGGNPKGIVVMWSEVEIAGHSADVFEPARSNPHGYVAIYLHGVHLNRLDDKPEFVAEFERHGLPVICPRTGRSWWTDKICREFDPAITAERYVLNHVVPFIAERWQAKPPRIGIFGTSMGGQGALRFAFKHPNTFPVVAAISPAIDYQSRIRYPEEEDDPLFEMYPDTEAARQDTATLHVHPLNWPRSMWFCCDPTDYRWHESADRLRMKLAALGVPYNCDLETSGGGHGFAYYGRMAKPALEFMIAALEHERLRIV
jgi:pimeloyl-ACP methyl ester carboxylesterase